MCYHHDFGIFSNKTGVFGKGMGVRTITMGFGVVSNATGAGVKELGVRIKTTKF